MGFANNISFPCLSLPPCLDLLYTHFNTELFSWLLCTHFHTGILPLVYFSSLLQLDLQLDWGSGITFVFPLVRTAFKKNVYAEFRIEIMKCWDEENDVCRLSCFCTQMLLVKANFLSKKISNLNLNPNNKLEGFFVVVWNSVASF